MGCNSSKQQDVQRDRQRQPQNFKEQEEKQVSKTAAVAVSGSDPVKNNMPSDGGVYSKSWTDEHLVEQDFLKKVLEKTQQNLIDVAQEPAILDEKDVEDRLERYNQFLKFDPVSVKKSLEELFALPGLPDPVVEELSEKDNAFMDQAVEAVRAALVKELEFKVPDDLVVHVDKLEAS